MFEINETNGVYTVTGSGAFDELVNVIGVEAKSKLSTRGKITDANSAQSYLSAYMFPLKHEEFWVLYLDTQHNVLEVKKLFSGTIDAAPIYPREVVVDALRASAAAVIFAHNHPTGNSTPSNADIRITKRLEAALNTVDISVLDHIIFGKGESASLKQLKHF